MRRSEEERRRRKQFVGTWFGTSDCFAVTIRTRTIAVGCEFDFVPPSFAGSTLADLPQQVLFGDSAK
jgi:hypothetical protein